MFYVFWIATLSFYTAAGESSNNIYLNSKVEVNASVAQTEKADQYSDECINMTSNMTRFPSLALIHKSEQSIGIFDKRSDFARQVELLYSKVNDSDKVEDVYIPSMQLNPATLLNACIQLMEKMRHETNAASTELSIIAIPKYMTESDNQLKLISFITIAQTLGTKMLIFWYQKSSDADILTAEINRVEANNVIVLLEQNFLNDVVSNAYNRNLFTWNRRWVLMALNGAMPSPPSGVQVRVYNVSVVHVGQTNEPLNRLVETVEDKLARDAAQVAKALLDKVCLKKNVAKLVRGTTGDFNIENLTYPRVTTQLFVYRGLTASPDVVGSITIKDNVIDINGSFNATFDFTQQEMDKILTSRAFRLAVFLVPPFAMMKTDAMAPTNGPVPCNITELKGLSIDIVTGILNPLGVTYECTCYPSRFREETLLSVDDGFAEMAVGEFAVTTRLKNNFDFISNFLYFTFSILEKPPDSNQKTYLWLFFKPLSPGTWVMVVFCCFVAALVMATLNYFSPNQVNYGFIESVFVTFGCLFQGLTVSPPNTWSSRVMQCVWWLFVLFFIVIYIANFAAIMMSDGIQNEATGFQALLVDASTPFGALPNSMAAEQLHYSSDLEIQKVNYLSHHLYPQDPYSKITIEDRVKEVAQGKYRLISDSFSLEYFASRYCLVVSGEYSSQQYAILLKRNAVYTRYLNDRLTNYTNEGKLKTIVDTYLNRSDDVSCKMPAIEPGRDETGRKSIALAEVGGIFILMLIGIIVAIIISIIECFFARKLMPLASRMVRSETRTRLRNFC